MVADAYGFYTLKLTGNYVSLAANAKKCVRFKRRMKRIPLWRYMLWQEKRRYAEVIIFWRCFFCICRTIDC